MIFQAYLSHIGLNRHYPREVIFGSGKYGGHGEQCLTIVQGYKHLQLSVGHLQNQDETGTLMRQECDYLQLLARVSTSIMSKDTPSGFLG